MSMRGWCWNGKGGEDGDTVVCVGIRRFGAGVWGAVHVSQGSLCWWWLNGCSVSGPCTVSWQIVDDGDGD